MNHEERFEPIEDVIVGLAEQRRQDREEYRQLWRDTERQLRESIRDTNGAIRNTNEAITRFAEESRAADAKLGRRIQKTDKQSKPNFATKNCRGTSSLWSPASASLLRCLNRKDSCERYRCPAFLESRFRGSFPRICDTSLLFSWQIYSIKSVF